MFKNVLVGVDCRPSGRDAIALAKRLVEPHGAITLAHVYSGSYTPSRPISPGVVREEGQAAGERLEAERREADIEAELVTIQAPTPGRGLHELAEEQHADLLVLGSCHRGPFGRAMLGDDTRAALNGAPCAVAIAPTGYAVTPVAFSTVGVGYDGSPESEMALETARVLAAQTGATIKALHVVGLPSYAYTGYAPTLGVDISHLVEDADAKLKALPGVEGRAVFGLAGEDLAAFGGEVNLLILGSRGYGPTGRLLHGSTTDYVQRHARGAVLILPHGSRRALPDTAESAVASQTPVPA